MYITFFHGFLAICHSLHHFTEKENYLTLFFMVKFFCSICLLSMWAYPIAHFNFLALLMFVPRWKPSCQVVPVWTNRRPLVEPASAKAPASPAGPQHTLRIALLVLFILMLALWALSYLKAYTWMRALFIL